jgi:hypothetical protein
METAKYAERQTRKKMHIVAPGSVLGDQRVTGNLLGK